jgi:tRNA modification GTPase
VQDGFTLDAAGVCIDDALDALYSLTGENATESVIDEVFRSFCVGK